jgi:hypothetical protein
MWRKKLDLLAPTHIEKEREKKENRIEITTERKDASESKLKG